MTSFTITINGQEVEARAGQTILDAAGQAGIDIPTLCHHPALRPIGACRVCLVAVSGQRSLQPACTFPVIDKMVVETESEKVVQARKFIIELIFSERNHFCMYCEMSGNCELQKLGYRYGLDHFMYPTYTEKYPVDASSEYFLIDHNRCVICRRCIRACDELAANHTLDVSKRGAMTMVTADLNEPLGKASCVLCGACLDLCPTGAIFEKGSAYMLGKGDNEVVSSICTRCGLHCGTEIIVRRGRVIGVKSRWGSPVSGGLLCKKGRFPSFSEEERFLKPMIRKNGRLMPVSWEGAMNRVCGEIRGAEPARLGIVTAEDTSNEALVLLKKFFGERIGSKNLCAPAVRGNHRPVTAGSSLIDIAESDCVFVVHADPSSDHPVASFFIKRAVDRGARLILLQKTETELTSFADAVFSTGEWTRGGDFLKAAGKPVVLYGDDTPAEILEKLKPYNKNTKWIHLGSGNSLGTAARLGFSGKLPSSHLDLVYILCSESEADPAIANPPKKTRIIIQASHPSSVTERADIILPQTVWTERSGTFTNTFGFTQEAKSATAPRGEAKADWEILQMLSDAFDSMNTALETICMPDAGYGFPGVEPWIRKGKQRSCPE